MKHRTIKASFIGEGHGAIMTAYRHWHASSEKYTGADSLFTALDDGWVMHKPARQEAHWRHSRQVTLFYIELQRADETAEMVIISNPYLAGYMARFEPAIAHA